MASIKERRSKVESIVYKVMKELDPSGNNVDTYRELFSKMSDSQFDAYMMDFLNDDKKNFYL